MKTSPQNGGSGNGRRVAGILKLVVVGFGILAKGSNRVLCRRKLFWRAMNEYVILATGLVGGVAGGGLARTSKGSVAKFSLLLLYWNIGAHS